MSGQSRPLRLFLDAGVIIDGCFNRWGSCKGVLILATMRTNFTVVLADPILVEVQRAVAKKITALSDEDARTVMKDIGGWLKRVRIEAVPWPTAGELLAHQDLLAAVRHSNDMPSVVAAVRARPDWILSTNDRHWNQDLGARMELRIASPLDFLAQLKF